MSSLSDKLTIETPEQMPLEFAVAGIGSRFLALAVDTLIQAGVGLAMLVILAVLGITGSAMGWKGERLWMTAAFGFAGFVLMFGYFAIFEIIWNGQTPGKRMVGIRVVKETGRPLTPSETIGRNLLRIVDQLPAFYAVGMLVALLNAKNKRLGDFIAGSVVVRETSMAEMRPIWQTEQSAVAHQAGAAQVSTATLSLEELALIDAFLHRRYDLDSDVRSGMAREIVTRLRPKIAADAQARLSTESLLEALAYERRSRGSYS
ncbi:MAG TPA: RDD family protein [Bryobacteraceae bacterium]|nr:RDD family protein [Bryobacteraceae bacterium]